MQKNIKINLLDKIQLAYSRQITTSNIMVNKNNKLIKPPE